MSENLYEGMFLLDSAKFASDPDGVSGKLLELLEKSGATIVTHRPWQDGRLAYPVEDHRKGLHYLTYFRMPGTGLTDLARGCKLSDVVLRHLVIRHPPSLFDAMVAALDGTAGAETETPAAKESPAKETTEPAKAADEPAKSEPSAESEPAETPAS